MYESTMDALVSLYPKLSQRGFCIVDDYGSIPACRKAVRDYRAAHGITDPIQMIDWTGAWWRKSGRAASTDFAASNAAHSDPVFPNPQGLSLGDSISIGSLACMQPSRLLHGSAWIEHVPFAFWLVEHLRPRRIVELGVQLGVSYAAFCQAVSALGLKCQCTGVDTFVGDAHTGPYGPQILQDLKAYHDPLYAEFSELVPSTFDAALDKIEDGAVDLLHIDGSHAYEDVKHDFESWRAKLSPRAVVLFHDTQVTDRGFGVWRLWRELAAQFPSFEFGHGYGLGVLLMGSDLPATVRSLAEASTAAQIALRNLFSTLGHRLTLLLRDADTSRFQSEIEILRERLSSVADHQVNVQRAFTQLAQQLRATQEQSRSSSLPVDQLPPG
jgi:hypothetical protein